MHEFIVSVPKDTGHALIDDISHLLIANLRHLLFQMKLYSLNIIMTTILYS